MNYFEIVTFRIKLSMLTISKIKMVIRLSKFRKWAEWWKCKFQVFDLGEIAPDKVLRTVYANLESLKKRDDEFAMKIMERLKLIVSCDTNL